MKWIRRRSFPGPARRPNCHLAIFALAILFPFSFFLLPCSAQGIVTTVAAGGWVFRGDCGPARDAPLGRIPAIAVDSTGNVFAADEVNHLVVLLGGSGGDHETSAPAP